MNNNYNNYNNQNPIPNQNMNMNMNYNGINPIPYEKKDNSPLVGYAGALVMAISIFGAYYSISSTDINYFLYGTGATILVLAVISALLVYAKKNILNVFTGVAGIILVIRDILVINDMSSNYTSYSIGVGVWLALIGCVILLVSCYLYWSEHPECLKGIIEIKPKQVYNYMPNQQPIPGNYNMNQNVNYENNQMPQQPAPVANEEVVEETTEEVPEQVDDTSTEEKTKAKSTKKTTAKK